MDKLSKQILSLFLLAALVIGVLQFFSLKALLESESRGIYYEYYSHIMLIPLVSVYLLFSRRKDLLGIMKPSIPAGVLVGTIGLIGYGTGLVQGQHVDLINKTAWQTSGLLILWLGTFLFFFGPAAFHKALFPLLFLFFMVPLPTDLMDAFINVLQVGSTWATAMIFNSLGVSFYQEGFCFYMGKVTIEVARECSGIRSTMALVITGVLAAHLFLRSGWKKLILILTILPISVLKNGLRIVILTLLAIHVDERFLTESFLHRSGGFLFYIPGLLLFGGILFWLRKMEKKAGKNRLPEPTAP